MLFREVEHGGGMQVQGVRGRFTAFDDEAYFHARNLRCVLRINAESVAADMGITSAEFTQLERTDMIFWSTRELRGYAEALGFVQWRVTHKDGRRRYVIAQSDRKAAQEALWQPPDCANIEKVSEPGEWRIERW